MEPAIRVELMTLDHPMRVVDVTAIVAMPADASPSNK